MPALDTLPRKDMLLVFNQLTKKLYAIQSAKNSKEYVQSLCQEKQQKYEKSMRTIRIIIILLCFVFLPEIMLFITAMLGLLLQALTKSDKIPMGFGAIFGVSVGVLILVLIILLYVRIKNKKQKALANDLNEVRPYIPFFDSIMQEAANDCYAFCTQFGVPKELQNYEAAAYVYTDLSTSASLPLYVAIENYREHKHRQEMQAYAAEQNALLQQQIEQDKAYYEDMLREASESNELLRRGNAQRGDILYYVRSGYYGY